MHSEDERMIDEDKNILKADGSFELHEDGKVSLKFKGTKGIIKNIAITTSI